jgi:hypothetical protein
MGAFGRFLRTDAPAGDHRCGSFDDLVGAGVAAL